MDPQKLSLFYQSLAGMEATLEAHEAASHAKLQTILTFFYIGHEPLDGTIYAVANNHVLGMPKQTPRERIMAAPNIFRFGKTEDPVGCIAHYRQELENASHGCNDYPYLKRMTEFDTDSWIFLQWKIPEALPEELIEMLADAANAYIVYIRYIFQKGGIGLKLPETVPNFSMSYKAAQWMTLMFPQETVTNSFLDVGSAVFRKMLSSDHTPLS